MLILLNKIDKKGFKLDNATLKCEGKNLEAFPVSFINSTD
jgi:hypothetical protein